MVKQKKSQTELIVTVLLILIVLTAVGIVGVFVTKIVVENSNFDIGGLKVSIEPENTVYNKPLDTLYFSIQREVGKVGKGELTGMVITVITDGEKRECVRRNVPQELERRVYNFAGFPYKPDAIHVSPIIRNNGKEKTLSVISKFTDILISEIQPVIVAEEFGGSCGDIHFLPPEPPHPPTS
jgi:flagellin-like protein